MEKGYLTLGLLIVQILIFTATLLSQEWDKKSVHYFILFLLCGILVTHIVAFNTDSEDIYISLRYVKNFVEGKGLVFNTFDKVEGYSDFLWVMLIAGIHKVLNSDIPLTARYLSVVFSVITLLYTYTLTFKLTQNKLISYLIMFLVSVNGSFACYGLAGLENPLFALFILLTINYTIEKKWGITGLLIGLLTMTRPEGFIMFFPVAFSILIQPIPLKDKIRTWFLIGIVAAITVLPWTIWRVSYYGYFIPNTIAAKTGMDLFSQLKIGIIYSSYFLFVISEFILVLILLPIINFIYTKQKIKTLFEDQLLILLFSTAITFILFYSYAGGDWMPCWRFYASIIPTFGILLAVLWNNYVFKNENTSILKSVWIAVIFVFCGYVQVRNSFMNANMIPLVKEWYSSVQGLKEIGKWFHRTLPENTLLATFPNGAFSYYNELPTIDYGGLTDNNVGRFGHKKKTGRPGHITENIEYILKMKPDIIAMMDGQGFVSGIHIQKDFEGYEPVTFTFNNYINLLGKYVNLNVRADKKEQIIQYLLKDKNVTLVKMPTP